MPSLLLIFLLSFLSFFCFSLCVRRHHELVFGRGQVKGWEFWLLQIVAWPLLIPILTESISYWGFGIGIMAWMLMLTLAAFLVVTLVNYLPSIYSWIARILLPWRWFK